MFFRDYACSSRYHTNETIIVLCKQSTVSVNIKSHGTYKQCFFAEKCENTVLNTKSANVLRFF
jgi:hypothetical protein